MPGTDAFPVKGAAPIGAELSETQPHDNQGPIVYGSAATYTNQAAGAKTPQVTIIAEEPARFSLPDNSQPDLVFHAGSTQIKRGTEEPLLYGSAQTIAGDANRPQYSSAQVVKEDPNVSNLDPGLALPYGNNEIGPAAVTGTLVLAPQTGGASGYVSSAVDPDVLGGPAKVTMGAGNNDSITTDLPTSGTASASQGNASGVSLLPSMKVDPNAGGVIEPVQNLLETGLAVTATNPTAPLTQSQPSATVASVQTQEGGGPEHTTIPTSQYGLSAP